MFKEIFWVIKKIFLLILASEEAADAFFPTTWEFFVAPKSLAY